MVCVVRLRNAVPGALEIPENRRGPVINGDILMLLVYFCQELSMSLNPVICKTPVDGGNDAPDDRVTLPGFRDHLMLESGPCIDLTKKTNAC